MYRLHFFIQSCFLVFVFVGPAAAQGLVKGQASADWEAANLTLPTPLQDDDQQGSGNNMVAWEYYTDGRTCDGEADAKSEQSNGSSSEYYVRKKRGT
ncbi:MAG: hypothetical protein CMJ94_07040 [Planctomycetes bacterium]|nr:hypothetical protein [Planctomycetota bacterium]